MAIRILLNGFDRTAALFHGATAQFSLMRGSRGSCTLPFVIEPDEQFVPQVGQRIEIYDPTTTRVWSGTVETLACRWLGDNGWRVVTVSGVTLEAVFDLAGLDRVKYSGVSAGSIVSSIFAAISHAGVTAGIIDDGPTIESIEVTNVAQALSQLALTAGFVWYVDPEDNTLNFHAPKLRAAPWTMQSTDVLWETIDWRQTRTDFRNSMVVQLPNAVGTAFTPVWYGDGSTTSFMLPTPPEYIISIDLSIPRAGYSIGWTPGTSEVTVTPALPVGASVTVKYVDSLSQTVSVPSPGIGDRATRYTKSRTFTAAGTIQEAEALVHQFALLPSQMSLSTDRPGIGIARRLTIDLDAPGRAAELLNGQWLVQEVDAMIVPGLEQRPEPFGHFRYQLHLINAAACAVFQGDGLTSSFHLPVIPDDVISIRTEAESDTAWVPGTDEITATPPLGPDDYLAVDYIDPDYVPTIESFVDTWDEMIDSEQPLVAQGFDPDAAISTVQRIHTLQLVIDGSGAEISTGIKADFQMPFDCTITGWTILADQEGSIVIDIWKDEYGNYPPTDADSITASAKPTLSDALKETSTTLTDWTTTIAAGDTLRFNVDSVTAIQRLTLQVHLLEG